MVKTKITETTEKFDEDGKLVERIVREETTEDDESVYVPYTTTTTSGFPKEVYCNETVGE